MVEVVVIMAPFISTAYSLASPTVACVWKSSSPLMIDGGNDFEEDAIRVNPEVMTVVSSSA